MAFQCWNRLVNARTLRLWTTSRFCAYWSGETTCFSGYVCLHVREKPVFSRSGIPIDLDRVLNSSRLFTAHSCRFSDVWMMHTNYPVHGHGLGSPRPRFTGTPTIFATKLLRPPVNPLFIVDTVATCCKPCPWFGCGIILALFLHRIYGSISRNFDKGSSICPNVNKTAAPFLWISPPRKQPWTSRKHHDDKLSPSAASFHCLRVGISRLAAKANRALKIEEIAR